MLRFFSIGWSPILKCAIYRYRNFIGNHMIRFTVWPIDSSYDLSASSVHFGITFAYFWFWILRNYPNKDSTEGLVRKGTDWSWRCQRGLWNIYISTGFFVSLVFKKSNKSFIEYSTVTFGFDPSVLFPTGYRKRATTILIGACSDIKKWFLNLHFTLLFFFNLNINYANMNWVDTFFLLSIHLTVTNYTLLVRAK